MEIENWESAGALPLLYDYLDPTRDALPPININANVHLMLTDYTKDDGAISFLPGSHRWRRQATPPESKYWADKAHAVEAAAGSMVIPPGSQLARRRSAACIHPAIRVR